jgi:hypothetical protein
MEKVEKVAVPSRSLIANVGFEDYVDAYRIRVEAERFPDVDAVAHAFVKTSPSWIAALMRLRDSLVGIFGLKRSVDAPPSVPVEKAITPGDFIGFFRVLERNDREILAGENDRHLDFRVSFLYERGAAGEAWVTVTTVVKFHNAFGRAYFVPVGPFHRRIVPAMLRAAAAG